MSPKTLPIVTRISHKYVDYRDSSNIADLFRNFSSSSGDAGLVFLNGPKVHQKLSAVTKWIVARKGPIIFKFMISFWWVLNQKWLPSQPCAEAGPVPQEHRPKRGASASAQPPLLRCIFKGCKCIVHRWALYAISVPQERRHASHKTQSAPNDPEMAMAAKVDISSCIEDEIGMQSASCNYSKGTDNVRK